MSWLHTKQEEWRCDQCSCVFRVIMERSGKGTWTTYTWIEGHKRQEECSTEQEARDVAQMAMNEHDQRFHVESLWSEVGQR